MLLEIAEIDVRPGSEPAFAQAMRGEGVGLLASCDGVISVQFGQGVEHASRFAFNVVWTSLEAHEAARKLDAFARFRNLFGDLAIGGTMHHFEMDAPVAGSSA
ncbi:antibiotic biosynthesis monooxygenase [Sphingomonas sp. IC081]|uniref:antibiotic biosynthesis monooxygenase family protein n=1 Tax=Sphingomonas sp. IC081 TaxID=304378 RepID=UPI0011590B3E|nr:antibiotic biosynthesis monooxygenase family protein [Sphingomonas sp. IC081]QDK34186.1 antibiotic biosynthesis monooxygenase [Sphingomonas sp. IC081]